MEAPAPGRRTQSPQAVPDSVLKQTGVPERREVPEHLQVRWRSPTPMREGTPETKENAELPAALPRLPPLDKKTAEPRTPPKSMANNAGKHARGNWRWWGGPFHGQLPKGLLWREGKSSRKSKGKEKGKQKSKGDGKAKGWSKGKGRKSKG